MGADSRETNMKVAINESRAVLGFAFGPPYNVCRDDYDFTLPVLARGYYIRGFSAAMREDFPGGGGFFSGEKKVRHLCFPGRVLRLRTIFQADLFGVNGDNDALAAEPGRGLFDEFRIGYGGGVDAHLVGSGVEQVADVIQRPHAAPHR